MLEPGDIEHVESVVNRIFPLKNCASWARIKDELVVANRCKPCEAHSALQGRLCAVTGATCTARCLISK
jgi:hypothetical protein